MFNWHTVGDCQVSECDHPWFTDDGLKQMFNWHTVGDCQVSECDQPWFTDDGLKQMFNWHTVGDCQVSECDQPWFTDDGLNEETRVWDGMYKVAVEYEVEAELFFLYKLGRK